MTKQLSQAYVLEALDDSLMLGKPLWRVRPLHHFKSESAMNAWNGRYAGTPAGNRNTNGYYRITLQNTNHKLHRICFLYHHGFMPPIVDHIDNDPSNNEIVNLRSATPSENMQNSRKRKGGKATLKGVKTHKNGRSWTASITRNYKTTHLGTFTSELAAHNAYIIASNAQFKEYANHG